jgi:hypothetical protein
VVVWCCCYDEKERKVSKDGCYRKAIATMVVQLTWYLAEECPASVLLCCGCGERVNNRGGGGECWKELEAIVR